MTYIQIAPIAANLAAAVNSNTWTTTQTVLRTITVNRTGYWWAAASLISADGGTVTNVTVRLCFNASPVSSVVYNNAVNGFRGSGLLVTGTPLFMSNGQLITLTAQHDTGSCTVSSALLSAGFVPSNANPK